MPNLRGKTWTPTTPAYDTDAQFWENHLISDADAARISSSVQTVNGTSPDAQGNVDVVALPDGGTIGQVLTKQSSADGDADWEDPASSGHTIQDEDGIDMPYQDTLQFVNAEVTNDTVNEKTVVDCKGAKGDPGPQGPQGPQGEVGATGPQGPQGVQGDAATITVGTVTTLPAGSQATVNNSGTSGAAVFDFGIPKGADGSGSGDMAKAEYATNGETGVVDEAVTLKGLTASIADLNKTSSLATVATTGAYSDLSGKPTLATVATSGSYNDLSNKPTIPAAQVNADWNANSGVAQILNKPTIPTVTDTYSATSSDGMSGKAVKSAIDALDKSDSAVSGQYVSAVSEANGIITVSRASLPTIPTVNDGQLTIQQNGTNKATFTANQSGNATANIVTDDWVATGTVSSGSVSFSGIDDSGNYGYKPFAEVTASSTNKNPSAQISTLSGTGTSSMSVTYTTDADNGTTVKLRRIK